MLGNMDLTHSTMKRGIIAVGETSDKLPIRDDGNGLLIMNTDSNQRWTERIDLSSEKAARKIRVNIFVASVNYLY